MHVLVRSVNNFGVLLVPEHLLGLSVKECRLVFDRILVNFVVVLVDKVLTTPVTIGDVLGLACLILNDHGIVQQRGALYGLLD